MYTIHQSQIKLVIGATARLTSLFTALFAILGSSSAHAESLLIKNVHIISGVAAKPSSLQDVLVQDGQIKAIGKQLTSTGPRLNAHGKFLIPGLIDSHVHLDGVPGYTTSKPEDAEMLKQAHEQMPRSYLYFGFTTVLDLTGDPKFIANWNQQVAAPKAYFCAPVVIPNGYPAVWMDKDAQFTVPAAKYMLFDPKQAATYPQHFVEAAHTPSAVVNAAQQDGASCIKVFYETGFGPKRNLPVPTVEMIQAVVQAAHQLDLPVFLHGNSQDAYEFALKTGVDTLVHGMWHEHKNADQLANQERLKQMSAEIVKAGIAIQPTIQVLYGEQEEVNPEFFNNPLVSHAIPAKLATWYRSAAGQWMKQMLTEELSLSTTNPDEQYQVTKKQYQKPLNTVKRMTAQLSADGAKIMFGSDTPSGPFYTQFPGINGRWEMDRWLETGMSLSKLFAALTIENARALKLDKEIGSIEVGKQANLLLLTKNPLDAVSGYDSIEQVIVAGKIHPRASLSASKFK
ncbi:MAG: amidohydrolase family protein [Undibacterium sp.]|nr:amidohydrolase family protein [Undibacterium sp.]